ncbi:MAG: tetratricopeptide repeat protein [Gemmataceae bacterium]
MREPQDIFHEALEKSPDELEAFLDEACGDDASLRAEILALLEYHDPISEFLQNPIVGSNTQRELLAFPIDSPTEYGDAQEESEEDHTLAETNDVSSSGTVNGLSSSSRPAWPKIPGYEIVGVIGRGGMGVIYRARQIDADRIVALKTILAGEHADREAQKRFRNEVFAIARLRHPGIIEIYDVGKHDGQPYFSMELCAAGSLDKYLSATPVPAKEAAELVRDVGLAIQAAHEATVIHRDLKPANILLTPRPGESVSYAEEARPPLSSFVARVTDFGLAKKLDDVTLTRTGLIMGTPSYMSPEQAQSEKELSPLSDVYSLGAILYECLTGRPPFKGATSVETVYQVTTKEPVAPRQLQPSTPRDMETICLKCLQKDPTRRYHSARELAEDLQRFLDGQPILARRVGRIERTVKLVKRNPVVASFTVFSVVAIFVILGGLLWQSQTETARAKAETARIKAEAEVHRIEQTQQYRQKRNREEVITLIAQTQKALRDGKGQLAETNLRQLEKRIEEGGAKDLRELVTRCHLECQTFLKLRAIDRGHWLRLGKRISRKDVLKQVKLAFSEFGISPGVTPTQKAARMIREASIREQLLASLEFWFLFDRRHLGLKSILTAVDPDPFRESVRKFGYSEALRQWKAKYTTGPPSPPPWFAVSHGLDGRIAQADRMRLLLSAYSAHPDNLSLLRELGHERGADDPKTAQERVGWCRAAIAVAPQDPVAWNNLGVALSNLKEYSGAKQAYLKALSFAPKEVAIHNNLGNNLILQRDWDEAIEWFRKAIQLNPRVGQLYNGLGTALRRKGDIDGALVAFQQAVRLRPKYPEAHMNLGILWAKDKKDFARAIPAYRNAIRFKLKDPEVYLELGTALGQQEEWYEAIKVLKTAIRLDPKLAEAHNNLAAAFSANGRIDEALEHARQAANLRPKSAEFQNSLGAALALKGRVAQAIATLKHAIELDPKLPRSYLQLAEVMLDGKQDANGAIEVYRQVIQVNPNLKGAHYNLGNILSKLGKADEAIEAFGNVICLDPSHAEAHNNLGRVLERKDDIDAAILCYREAARLNPKLLPPLANLGTALKEHLGDYRGAIAAFRKALIHHPNQLGLYYQLGLSYEAAGDVEGAVAVFSKAVRKDRVFLQELMKMGKRLGSKKRDYDGAVACFRALVKLKPKSPANHFALGLAQSEKGDFDGAIASLRQAVQLKPKFFQAQNLLGVLLCDRKQRYDEAIVVFRKYIKLRPNSAGAHYNLATALTGKGDIDGAIEVFQKVVALDPKSSKAHLRLGDLYRKKKRLKDALASARKAVMYAWKDAKAHALVGSILKDMGNISGAREALRKAVVLNPNLAPLLKGLPPSPKSKK